MKTFLILAKCLSICLFIRLSTTTAQAQWDVGGNYDNGSGLLLGTNDQYPLNLIANSHKHLTIRPTQVSMVGIGTEEPNTNLHVHGSGYIYLNDKGQPIQEPGTFGSTIQLTTGLTGVEPTNGFRIGIYNNTCFLTSDDNLNFTINNGESNMNIKSNGTINFFTNYIGQGGRLNLLADADNNGLCIKKETGTASSYGLRIETASTSLNALEVKKSSDKVFVVKNNGQTGIGTGTPDAQYMLDVAGKMRTCEVRVNNPGWCDYVFATNYHLMSLGELALYIEENKHLPEMPSAAEVEAQGGFDVAQMSTALLKRAEENILYIIALEQKTEETEKQLEEQKAITEQAQLDATKAKEEAEALEKRVAELERKMNALLMATEKK